MYSYSLIMFKRLFSKILARDGRGHDFTEDEQLKSQVSRSAKSLRAANMEVQKMLLDAEREKVDELKARVELKILKEKTERLQEQLFEDDEDNEDDEDDEDYITDMESVDNKLLKGLGDIAMKFLNQKTQVSQPISSIATSDQNISNTPTDVSDEEIKMTIEKIPVSDLNKLRKLDDVSLKKVISMNYAGLTDNTMDRIVKMVRA